jgi:hypothetical protein
MAMRGPEHYKEAEKLLDKAKWEKGEKGRILQEAQAHATLALLSAVLQAGEPSSREIDDWKVWGLKF